MILKIRAQFLNVNNIILKIKRERKRTIYLIRFFFNIRRFLSTHAVFYSVKINASINFVIHSAIVIQIKYY